MLYIQVHTIITYSLLRIITYYYKTIITYYYIIITSLLQIITVTVFCYYVLLQDHYYILLYFSINTHITSLLHIITYSLLYHYYVIITSLSLVVFILIPLLPIITINTHYYQFETGQLADVLYGFKYGIFTTLLVEN